jgi:hypothetical protein
LVICFTVEGEYSRAARSIRCAQFQHFERLRLGSQPAGAIDTVGLIAASSRSSATASIDVKVKVGDGDESIKCVSVDGEVLIIESKSKGLAGVLRSKRVTLSTPGLSVSFVDPVTIALPSRDSDVTFSFPDSLARDLFAYKIFLHAKGDPRASSFSVITFSAPSTSSASSRARSQLSESGFGSRFAASFLHKFARSHLLYKSYVYSID